jgi:hypothetical protein
MLKQRAQEVKDLDAAKCEPGTSVPISEIVLGEICRKHAVLVKDNRGWSNRLVCLAFVLYVSSAKAYRFVKAIMPLPSVSQLYQRMGQKLRFLKDRLTAIDGIGEICEAWRQKEAIPTDAVIVVILGSDVASFRVDEINGRPCAYCFAFVILPLNPYVSTRVCHLCPWESGAIEDQKGMHLCKCVVEKLSKCNVNAIAIAIASDGDRSYIRYQNRIFSCYDTRLDQSLEELSNLAVDSCFSRFWWAADSLHALKCQRCRLRTKLFIKPSECFDAKSLNFK